MNVRIHIQTHLNLRISAKIIPYTHHMIFVELIIQ